MASRNKRVMKEIKDCQRDSNLTQINIQMLGEDLTRLRGNFPGPTNSPYEGGTFEVDIEVPIKYPFEPLKMKFITKVYHPNVSSQSGAICLDILKDAWSPVLTLKTTLVSLQSLLCSPEPNDPQDAEVAKVYLSNRHEFERIARYWTQTYAGGNKKTESSTRSMGSSSTSQTTPTTTAKHNEESGIEVIALETHGSSTSTTNSNRLSPQNSPENRVRTGFNRDVEDQIRNFALDRDQINQFIGMGFSIDAIISAMIHVKLANDDGDSRTPAPFATVLEALLN